MKILSIFFLLTIFCRTATANVSDIRLKLVGPDVNINCERTFFLNADPTQKELFTTPSVFAGHSIEEGGGTNVKLEPFTYDGEIDYDSFLFQFGVIFSHHFQNRLNGALGSFKRCDFEMVKHDLMTESGIKIDRIRNMPITSIEISIPDLANPQLFPEEDLVGPFKVGQVLGESDQTDILEYVDTPFFPVFRLTKSQSRFINDKMSSKDGLQVMIRFRFQSERQDGSFQVEYNFDTLDAALDGQVNLPTHLAKIDLKAELELLLRSSQTNVNVRFGQSGQSDELIVEAAKNAIAQIDSDIDKLPSREAEDAETGSVKKEFEVSAAIRLLKANISNGVSIDFSTPAQDTVAKSFAQLRHPRIDDNLLTIGVKDGFSPNVLPFELKKGDLISIGPQRIYLVRREPKVKESLLTEEDLRTYGVRSLFPEIIDDNINIENTKRGGETFAVGNHGDLWRSALLWPAAPTRFNYYWKLIERDMVETYRKTQTHFDIGGDHRLSDIPLLVTFGHEDISNQRYSLSGLLNSSKRYFEAVQWGSAVLLRAKVDLGTITFRDSIRKSSNEEQKAKYVDRYLRNKKEEYFFGDQVSDSQDTDLWDGVEYEIYKTRVMCRNLNDIEKTEYKCEADNQSVLMEFTHQAFVTTSLLESEIQQFHQRVGFGRKVRMKSRPTNSNAWDNKAILRHQTVEVKVSRPRHLTDQEWEDLKSLNAVDDALSEIP